nr:hypothetical protein [Mycoplasmopsis bovis]
MENKTPMREILRKARQTMALVEVKIILEVKDEDDLEKSKQESDWS